MEVDDIIKRLAWAAKLYGGSRRNRECDQGSRARDWKIEDHDVVTAEKASFYSVFLIFVHQFIVDLFVN